VTRLACAGRVRGSTLDVPEDEWVPEARRLQREGWWFEGLWATAGERPSVRACWGRPGELLLATSACPEGTFRSFTSFLPAADWFERAARDRSGLAPVGHVDPRAFLFHDTYPPGHVEGAPLDGDARAQRSSYAFVQHQGAGVFEIPVGPIHAGVIEPGHFRFTTTGELVLDLELRLNYTHKGTLTLVRGRRLDHAARLLERLSGDNAAAHALAFSSAAEAALGLDVPNDAQDVRTAMLEAERVYNHLGDLAGIATDVAFSAGASHFAALREACMRWNARLFGHRLLMNTVVPGGLLQAPSVEAWSEYATALDALTPRVESAVRLVTEHSGLRERVEGTGVLPRASAELLGCVGPAARACGIARDARADAPCLAYDRIRVTPSLRSGGDVASRMAVKVDELRASLGILRSIARDAPIVGPAAAVVESGEGEGIAAVEASRGAVLAWTRVADGRVVDAYQRDPSFLNWRGLQQAVHRNIVPDFPLINKSFNLSYSGSDA